MGFDDVFDLAMIHHVEVRPHARSCISRDRLIKTKLISARSTWITDLRSENRYRNILFGINRSRFFWREILLLSLAPSGLRREILSP